MVHMIGDMLTSAGVIVAALIIYIEPKWKIADPICTFLFSVLVIATTLPITIDCMRILMEGSPEEVDTVKIFNAMNDVSIIY